MALLRKLFARKAMDGLSCISERVYVFNSCLSTDQLDADARRDHLTSTVIQLKSCHPHDASIMLLHFFAAAGIDGNGKASVDDALLRRHGVSSVAHYPCHAHAPCLPLATTRALLASCVDWLVTGAQRNVLLMHCDARAWPALALAIASLLVHTEDQPAAAPTTTLAAVYGRAPASLLAFGSPLDPHPSHLRYLQYVTRLRGSSSSIKGMMTMMMTKGNEPSLVLDCIILRSVPDFDGYGGCRPVVRVHGRHGGDDDSPEILFTTSRIKQRFRQYTQAKNAVIKANIECLVRGDVVVECAHVGENTNDDEAAMFRVMFNTCFVESNMMVLTLDDIDLPWNCTRERFQEDFKIEVFFSDGDASDDCHTAEMLGDCHDENAEEFYDFDDISIDSGFNSTYHEQHDEDGQIKSSDTSSSEEKGINGSGNEVRFIPEADITRESKDSSEEKGNLQDERTDAVQSTLLTSKGPNRDTATESQEKRIERAEEGVIHQVHEACIQEGATSRVRTEVSHNNNMAGMGALNPKTKRRTWQNLSKQSAIPIIKKKVKKPDIESNVKKPSKGKMLLKQTLQKGILIATSSCKNSTVQANTGPIPRMQHVSAIKSKQATAQATKSPTLSKTNLESSSHEATEDTAVQNDGAIDNTTTEKKPSILSVEMPPSSPSPPRHGLNQEGSKESLIRSMESATKSPAPASGNSMTGGEAKQEATTMLVEATHPKVVLKRSLSSPAISRIPTARSSSSPKRSNMKPNHPSNSVLLKVASSSSSPRARASPLPPVLLKVASISFATKKVTLGQLQSQQSSISHSARDTSGHINANKDAASPCIFGRVNLFSIVHEQALSIADSIQEFKEPTHWHERQQQKLVTSIAKIGKNTTITSRDMYSSYHSLQLQVWDQINWISTSTANKIELVIFLNMSAFVILLNLYVPQFPGNAHELVEHSSVILKHLLDVLPLLNL
uniref:C2 tensin-type domain-containing protein n=1 Tax=Leersia perrieri TaxID=77586 RepID=A0A0D9VVI1_9ORYZ